ncbi:two-component system OmpR family sensor kinase [Catenulispora sp. GP43]|uniref:sensor histidine kinase n=1 Tax=Catenulispora sp. GP43 TaxID=3156263 RepID=UPI0035188FDA
MLRRSAPPAPERRMLARAAAVLACRIASGFLVALALLGFCAYRVVLDEQRTQARHEMAMALDLGSPDQAIPCLWLFEVDGASVRHAPQVPAGFPLQSAVAGAQAGAPPAQTHVTVGKTDFEVLTVRRGAVVRQAVFDTWYQQADLDHLARALLLAGLLGVVLATVTGAVLGRRSIAPLGDALERQRRFVADASHELRTPLTRLHTRAQMLLRWQQEQASADGLPEERSERLTSELRAMVQSAGEVNEVVEDLLMSAGMRTGPNRGEYFDLATLAAEVIEAERPRLAGRALVLTTVGDGLIVKGARSSVRRMISTLLDNAVSHTTPTGRIELSLRRAGRGIVELDVTDDGDGFDPADRERIFERFAQSGSPGPHHFGLGLALAREIATDHGGTIRAVGRPGQGAAFTVRLPLTD